MTCSNTRLALSDRSDAHGWIRSIQLQRHLAACAECAQFAGDLRTIEAAATRWRSEAAPQSLGERLRMGVENGPRPVEKKGSDLMRYRRTLAGLVATSAAVVAVGVFLLVPHGRSAKAVAQDMVAAVARIRNAHITMWSTDYTDNGAERHFADLQKIEEQWYQNKSWRKEGVWGSRLIIGYSQPHADGTIGTYYRYDSDRHKVDSMGETGEQMSDFTLRGLIGEQTYDSFANAQLLAHTTQNGRAVTELALSGPGEYSMNRDVCWIDDATNLPIEIDRQSQQSSSSQWKTTLRYTLEFNKELPQSLFDPSTLKDEGWSPPKPR